MQTFSGLRLARAISSGVIVALGVLAFWWFNQG